MIGGTVPCGQQKLAVDVVAAHLRHPSHWTAAKDLSIYDGKSKEAPMGILNTLLRAVTWWNGQTIGTQVFTWRRGERVGEDSQGNVFYRTRDDAKRWVIYNGEAEASRVDPEWHGWLHGAFDDVPESNLPPAKVWEADYTPNATGTAKAYLPQGSLDRGGKRAKAVGDYEAWSPEG